MAQSTHRSREGAAHFVAFGGGSSCPVGRSTTSASPEAVIPQGAAPAEGALSARLRAETSILHLEAERQLGLPGAIRTLDDYKRWLVRFLGLYGPLERLLGDFGDWSPDTVPPPSFGHGESLRADLHALGIDPTAIAYAPGAMLPPLPTFAHAVGALYVLEGSSLGGRVILRRLEERIGPQICVATRFFGGRGAGTGPAWLRFRADLDTFARREAGLAKDAISGAENVFRSLLAWFAPMTGALNEGQAPEHENIWMS